MLCQNCQQREATIHLYANVNGNQQEINLCQNCYQLLKQKQGNSMNSNDPFGFSSIDDLFNQLNGAQQENNLNGQPTSERPTQAGRNGGGNKRGNSILAQFGVDLTELARTGKIDPVIGRDKEIARVIEILNRRTKNNPVLIGEAGVGKTAVVEGLAQQIADGAVPAKLQEKKVIRLDVVSLVQGTGIRGQFEQRMQQLIDEIQKDNSIILFIDEIHEIVGAGNAEGGMDAGNVLKPALARGELQLVGATTLNEYRTIEKDSALARRFQPVQVNEPSVDETIQILRGLQPKYEAYHHVKFTEGAVESAVKLSARYIQDRFLPDKAIDLLDEAGSRMNLTIPAIDEATVKNRIDEAERLKQDALKNEDYEKAAYYRDQIDKYNQMKNENTDPDKTPQITEKIMEKIVEEKTNIPVGELKAQEQNQLKNLADDLHQHVIGQDEAVDKVAKAIRRNRVGFNKTGRPIGSFLFVGPTGVGKTELAKQLAKQLFGSDESMIRFDMSEYMEKHSISKLIGSPPGYVGYEEAGQLTEQVRRHPYSLILFDEIEKAHPDVLHMFLQILDDGRLTDSQGRTVSFKDTIIIMTSNAGQGVQEANVGFAATINGITHSIMNKLTEYFTPEFLNRLDDIVEFKQLSKENLLQIVDLMIDDTNKMIADQGLTIKVTDPAKSKLVELGYDPAMGARPLRRTIQEQIEDKVADFYLENPQEQQLEAKIENNEIKIAASKTKTK
ncbi:negative regulator of genetic competence clpc mecb [Amylolactobacillus amylotrophicus DSM 20534]|uniref:Negative regulator of genetic competence clpc mecb n=3 Tax=Amylolactobacillus TaxID=2767876 RepID=A0A0R1YNQ3_9LACO|nr:MULTISPECIES: ATP-dependent Clp protease ATP-binding subunit [Amylolactobacillus]APT18904.1 ATP-dependent Clp protease ATP-binding subunit [Amylolactobacillus amylophilus DSM 20533 = JCM 1125]KRK38841.1 negative regulator of genetic competence clpc mecb [Amylolactobacillus amylotrophicus DSM 20534]KRM42516.1 negative regulator of genetic competence clpc mecb [Amylolactobacillus amylophilus DSM 20533 = JCM 1125]GED80063.1 ATP-dependent Clp protease ClpE [Amylolactobacillus amylophilus]